MDGAKLFTTVRHVEPRGPHVVTAVSGLIVPRPRQRPAFNRPPRRPDCVFRRRECPTGFPVLLRPVRRFRVLVVPPVSVTAPDLNRLPSAPPAHGRPTVGRDAASVRATAH